MFETSDASMAILSWRLTVYAEILWSALRCRTEPLDRIQISPASERCPAVKARPGYRMRMLDSGPENTAISMLDAKPIAEPGEASVSARMRATQSAILNSETCRLVNPGSAVACLLQYDSGHASSVLP